MLVALRAQFDSQRQQIVGALGVVQIERGYRRKEWLDELIDWLLANQNMAEALKPTIFLTLLETGRDALQELGTEPSLYDPYSPALTSYFQDRAARIAVDVNEETDKQLRASLAQGVREGEGITSLRARVEEVLGSASTMRADRIARTEVTRAQGYADIQAWTQSGVVSAKEWFTAEDEHVCPFCESQDHRIVPLNDNFFNQGDVLVPDEDNPKQKLKLDYDHVPSAPLHVNCRCVLLPVRN